MWAERRLKTSLIKIETAEKSSQIVPVYFDSALIAKFYLNEPGREAIRSLARDAGIVVTSGIAMAEVSAAFHRKLREGSVDRDVFDALQGQFQHDRSEEHTSELQSLRHLVCRLLLEKKK